MCICCVVFWALSFVLGGALSAQPVVAGSTEGCVAVPEASCSYIATRPGGIAGAGGPWQVDVERHGKTLSYFGDVAPIRMSNVIRPGDRVTASARLAPFCPLFPAVQPGVVHVGAGAPASPPLAP